MARFNCGLETRFGNFLSCGATILKFDRQEASMEQMDGVFWWPKLNHGTCRKRVFECVRYLQNQCFFKAPQY